MKKALSIMLMIILVTGMMSTCVTATGETKYSYLYPINKNDKWGYIDSSGEVVVRPKYVDASEFSEGLAAVCANSEGTDKWGYINSDGDIKIKPQYIMAGDFHEGIAAVVVSDDMPEVVFIDRWGKQLAKVKDSAGYSPDPVGFQDGIIALYLRQRMSTTVKYIDKKGNLLREEKISFPQTEASQFRSGLRKITRTDGKIGYADATGQTVIVSQYDNATDFYGDVAWVKKDNRWTLIDKTGKELNSTDNQIVSNYYNGYAKVQIGQWDLGKWGYIDMEGNMVIPPKYNYAMDFSEGLAAVKEKGFVDYAVGISDGGFEYIDAAGKTVITPSYMFAESFTEGLASIYNGEHTFIDKTGKVAFKAFSPYLKFSEGYLAVRMDNGKYQYIDKEGKKVIDGVYDEAFNFREGLARVAIGGKYGFIDKSGKVVVEPKYTYAGDFSEGLALVKSEGKYYYINKDGAIAVAVTGMYVLENDGLYSDKAAYYGIRANSDFHEGLAVVRVNGRAGFIDKSGKLAISPQFNFVSPFSEGLAFAQKSSTYGFIDKSGQFVIQSKYKIGSGFKDGRAVIIDERANNKLYMGFIDKTGKEVIQPQYVDAGQFFNGLAKVKPGLGSGKMGLVDSKGNIVLAPNYDDLGKVSENMVAFMDKGKWGYMDLSGEIVIKPQFEEAYEFRGRAAKVVLDGRIRYIGKSGRTVWREEE